MERCEIKKEDQWDLSKFYKNKDEYLKSISNVKKLLDVIKKMKGHILDDANSLYEYLIKSSELSLEFEKVYVYSYLFHYQDTNEEEGLILKDSADKLAETISIETSFCETELLSKDFSYIEKLIKEKKELEKYRFRLEKIFRYQKYTLSEKEEKIISYASNIFNLADQSFSSLDNADALFEDVIINGENIKLNHSNYIKLMNDKNQANRKQVFQKYYNFYLNHKNTISEMYKGQLKIDNFFVKAKGYESALQMSLYQDNINPEVYYNLIKTINDKLSLLHNYMTFRKEFLNLKEQHMYDIYYDPIPNLTKKYTFDEAKDIILNSLSVLGKEYVTDLSKAFENRWIDKYPNDGKRSGAYQWGCYGIDPYVSTNFENDEDSVSTLAHELGHAMHSYYSDKHQEYDYAQYPIFLAEIASTVNEILVNEYLLNNSKTEEEKEFFIFKFLDKFRATVYRQTQFAEFELICHDKELNGESLTTNTFASIYEELNKKYYGKDVICDDEIKYEWSRIPHFYTSFYVYKYATGFCAALAIASDILNNVPNAKENYLEFLKSGGSNYPLEILKKCGIDMNTKEPFEKALKMFEDKLKMIKKIRREEK